MIIGIILILLAGVLMVLYLKNQGFQCMNNPISYYQLKENTSCFCIDSMIK